MQQKILKKFTSNAFVDLKTTESVTYYITNDFKILYTIKYKNGYSSPGNGFYELTYCFKKEEAMVHAEFESILKYKAFA